MISAVTQSEGSKSEIFNLKLCGYVCVRHHNFSLIESIVIMALDLSPLQF